MDLLAGKTLHYADGTTRPAETVLANKAVVALYFSAHWCPPCRQFTPVLKEFYDEVAEAGVEIVFVSSDRSAEDMANYIRESHGAWPALPHGSDVGQALKQRFSISGIPSLVILNGKTGELVTKDGRTAVQSKGPAAIKDWGL